MKKLFFRRRSALSESRLFSFGAILIAVGLIVALVRVVAPDTFLTLAAPVLREGSLLSVQTERIMSGFANTQTLASEHQALVVQNNALSIQNQILAARVQDLTALVGTTTPSVYGIVAAVLARPPESPYDTLVVDAGTKDGAELGDKVLAMGGVPIGAVSAISPRRARITLFSAPLASTTAWVGNARIPIVLEGSGAGTFIAQIPRAAGIVVGDKVFVPGKGIRPIGTVKRIDTSPAAITEILRIRPTVNIFSLTVVEIVPSNAL